MTFVLVLCVLMPSAVIASLIAVLVVRQRRRPVLRWAEQRTLRLPASETELFGEARHALEVEVELGPDALRVAGAARGLNGGTAPTPILLCPATGRPCSTPVLCAARGCPLVEE